MSDDTHANSMPESPQDNVDQPVDTEGAANYIAEPESIIPQAALFSEIESTPDHVSAPAEAPTIQPEPEIEQSVLVVEEKPFEDLTIAEALSGFWRAPFSTIGALWAVARTPKPRTHREYSVVTRTTSTAPVRRSSDVAPAKSPAAATTLVLEQEEQLSRTLELVLLAIRAGAFVIAWIGCYLMVSGATRSEIDGLNAGIIPLFLGMALWLISEIAFTVLVKEDGKSRLFQRIAIPATAATQHIDRITLASRALLLIAAAALAVVSVVSNTNNLFTPGGVVAWVFSIGLAFVALTPADWSVQRWLAGIGSALRPRWNWAALIVIVLMVIGAYLRLNSLPDAPPEMTSDHVEMLRDVFNISLGENSVFFGANGGREAAQFYLFSLLANVPGLGINFDTLKLLTVIEGILTIPVIFFMAREIVGREQKQLATLVGLTAAALVTVSFWHIVISRLGERIALMPLFTALFALYFARALRYNRRTDFLYAGLALGFGLYTYQAFRMIPLVVAVGGLIAILFSIGTKNTRRLVLNLIALGVVAFVIYLPLFSYSLQYPEDYWRRTSGRLFGDEITQTTDENGVLVYRAATLQERLTAFNENIPVLLSNIRNALLMYNWKGDVAWFNNAPNEPAFDPISGGLLVVGVAAWIGRMIRRRDAMTWLVPVFLIIMILPSAFSIAYPIENPSATRMSGTLPIVYLLAGLSFALLLRGIARVISGTIGWIVALIAAAALIAGSYAVNNVRYFDQYVTSYRNSSLPYRDAAEVLRGFAENVGGWGNAFVINYPYWWDHRALAYAAGMPAFPNGIPSLSNVPSWLENAPNQPAPFALDVNRDLLFFYAAQDEVTQEWLQMIFPTGTWVEMTTSHPEDVYRIFRVPALGEEGYRAFLDLTLDEPSG